MNKRTIIGGGRDDHRGRTKERRERLSCGVFAITNRNVKVENRNEIERQLVVFAITNRNVKSTLHFSG